MEKTNPIAFAFPTGPQIWSKITGLQMVLPKCGLHTAAASGEGF